MNIKDFDNNYLQEKNQSSYEDNEPDEYDNIYDDVNYYREWDEFEYENQEDDGDNDAGIWYGDY